MISMNEVELANGTHAVVAVELCNWLRLSLRLRLIHRNLRSLWHPLVPLSLTNVRDDLPLALDALLKLEELGHAALLRIVEARGDLGASLGGRVRERSGSRPVLALSEPHCISARGLSSIHWTCVPKEWQLLWA